MKTGHAAQLPLDAIGALELGRKDEAILIVRKELELGPGQARDLVENYLQLHPSPPPPVAGLDNSACWVWMLLAGLVTLILGGLLLVG